MYVAEVVNETVGNIKTGLDIELKSILTLPVDSVEFKIPSLSKSRSILSTIPSPSKSVGQILTIWVSEIYCLPM